jgi:hypothetical protein
MGAGLWSGVLVWGPLLGLPGWKFVGLGILVGGGILVYALLGQLVSAPSASRIPPRVPPGLRPYDGRCDTPSAAAAGSVPAASRRG